MSVQTDFHDETLYCNLEGEIDHHTALPIRLHIDEKIELCRPKNLILDLKGLEYISSAGLRVLLAAQKKMQQIGSMKVINVVESVMEVFEITGFADILTIE